MSDVLQAILTSAGNILGYASAVFVMVVIFRGRNPTVSQIGTAFWALFLLWAIVLSWSVASGFWLNTFPEHSPPDWLDASNNIAWNMQSEVWQVWLATLFFKWLRAPGSPDSK